MGKKNPEFDRYIREANPFARPLLKRIRAMAHKSSPKLEEVIKWNAPFFMCDDKIVCVMAAFKAHVNFGFWKGAKIVEANGKRANVGMSGRFGHIKSVDELPSSKAMASYVKQAIAINAKAPAAKKGGAKKTAKKSKPPLTPPSDFMRALRANGKALGVFKAFSPSKQRDYIVWITDAKTEETRERRLETSVDWLSQGKSRMWKYEK